MSLFEALFRGSPNEDVGTSKNIRERHFVSTFHTISYYMWDKSDTKYLPHIFFEVPTSSFGEHTNDRSIPKNQTCRTYQHETHSDPEIPDLKMFTLRVDVKTSNRDSGMYGSDIEACLLQYSH